ncbi:MAG: hypothetical protein EOP10_21600 [Proteobacteria bacterium]|nr:MAG: hypothetical protein EOP10_21600 [Pseudomonadota bacterium]
MKTHAEQLEDVRRAIYEIEVNGIETEIEVNGNRRRVKRSDLKTLYAREAHLLRAVERESRQGLTYIIPI